ncbi:MAG: EF-P lysine aminoacylase GenX [Gammaproteobacteria bacterium RIFCSPLOWO2_02_FULL_38_11]|nr:MAG: EF-P lysine aminoacylase GenX [Gammaproteobacteria bacterium RIFCSPHIGHO2_02_FULL_38_33]OGT24715.1 MAG: EF-P lysine aminoacylase GenX [Gammaproteobacteria bacterium RIFCSPHIGHO2_12_38_15]OGT67227.1 MAG: EF-P lysine aminoacylase GenX [Gammaproteobacteria bacterium RIFCSPLOWO2_02_FULL_38_11]
MSDWKPIASIHTLQLRAAFFKKIRHFFEERKILEVETPQLSRAMGTDPYLHYFTTDFSLPNTKHSTTLYLQTSPEFAMKRLLAAGSGSIYQICKAYRNGESGRLHNLEFTMLEWYRVGFDHHDLMKEVDAFLQTILDCKPAHYISYRSLFENHFDFNPHEISLKELKEKTKKLDLEEALIASFDKDTFLQYLLATFVEPQLGLASPVFVYDFPASQAALARIKEGIASRFEVYIQGIELANGFHELNNAEEQRKRFENDLKIRQAKNYPLPLIDNYFLESLSSLPDCAGIALGIDRLIMIALKKKSLKDVITFSFENT